MQGPAAMANDYLTLKQVCEMLGKSAEEIQALVAGGQLRETQDAKGTCYPRVEVERIAAKEGSSIVDLSAADVGPAAEGESFASALSDLAEASSGFDLLDASPGAAEAEGGPAPSPLDLHVEDVPEDLPAAPKAAAEEAEPFMLEPAVPDLSLSGSSIISLDVGLEQPKTEPPKRAAADQPGKKVGINVFDDDELGIQPDPMGETQIAATVEELAAVGSGSGLLDLTRESDGTSLGPELLDVLSPQPEAEETATEAFPSATAEGSGELITSAAHAAAEAPFESVVAAPSVPRAASMATTGVVPLNVCLLLGVLGLAMLGLATAAQLQGVWPAFLDQVAKGVVHYAVFGGVALVALVLGLVGIIAGKK